MKKILILFCVIISISNYAQIDITQNNQKTSICDNGRYEIIQSIIRRDQTFKLDKYTGDVFQLTKDKDGDLHWDIILIENSLKPFLKEKPNKVSYQLFMSGMTAADVYLLNINTGDVWQLVLDTKTKISFFSKIKSD